MLGTSHSNQHQQAVTACCLVTQLHSYKQHWLPKSLRSLAVQQQTPCDILQATRLSVL
jgi:hypothetical protein